MSNLINSQTQLDNNIQTLNLKAYIGLSFERLALEPFNIDKMVNDVLNEFPKLTDDDFKKAIRNGSLGKYGRTFRLSTQEVCIWIRQYENEKPNPFKNEAY